METSHDPDLSADFAGRLKRTKPPPAVAAAGMSRVGRSRLVRSDVAREIEDGDPGDADPAVSGDSHAGPIRSTALRGAARPALPGLDDRLLADARDACRREGIAATRRELLMRVAKRVGLSPAQVARGLQGALRHDGVAAAFAGLGARHARDRVSRLVATILGAREREVFLARRAARADDIAALQELASSLELSVERVYELDASARRKLATALG